MPKINVCLDGQRFGRWVVKDTIKNYKGTHTYCLCHCDCGNEKYVARYSLLNGDSTSCGCLSKEKISQRSRKDYVGCKFGFLTVIEMLYGYKNNKTYCRCLCDCGHEHIVSESNLITDHVKSCGCKTMDLIWGGRRTNLAGMIFNKLTVIEMLYGYGKNKRTHCRCMCECGNETIADMHNLLSGATSSCGCGAVWCRHGDITHKNLIGLQFGQLFVINQTDKKSSNGCIIWECQCSCGNVCNASTDQLTRYKKTSCGCSNYSNGENYIADLLQKNKIFYIPQARFNDCRNILPLPFDFYLPDYNTVIEYDGQQHYKSIDYFGGEDALKYRIHNDQIKNQYCQDNHINLLRLPYTLTNQEIENNIIHIWNP